VKLSGPNRVSVKARFLYTSPLMKMWGTWHADFHRVSDPVALPNYPGRATLTGDRSVTVFDLPDSLARLLIYMNRSVRPLRISRIASILSNQGFGER